MLCCTPVVLQGMPIASAMAALAALQTSADGQSSRRTGTWVAGARCPHHRYSGKRRRQGDLSA